MIDVIVTKFITSDLWSFIFEFSWIQIYHLIKIFIIGWRFIISLNVMHNNFISGI